MTTAPLESEAEARAYAHSLGGPPAHGRVILSPGQRLTLLTRACEDAGVTLGPYDTRFLQWMSGWGDGFCGVLARLVTARMKPGRRPVSDEDRAVRLLEQALFLRMYGERPPGAPPGKPEAETWAKWQKDTEAFLRERHPAVIKDGTGQVG